MFNLIIFIIVATTCTICFAQIATVPTVPKQLLEALGNTNGSDAARALNSTRRILDGNEASLRPYMVYLKLPVNNPKYKDYRRWLCGGVIVHEEYVLTSAACIEDVKHFYIVSGTFRHDEKDDKYNNQCIKFGAKKAVWKCIPRNYIFDGHENDNIRWMNNDIAVVRVEDEFDFTRKIRGCDFVPQPVRYNNESNKYEEPGQLASIAGWGSITRYNDPDGSNHNLLEADVRIISKTNCKRKWGKRYHNIIDNYMICTKDNVAELSELCQEKYTECTEVFYEDEEDGRRIFVPKRIGMHSAHDDWRRKPTTASGGFCENDHGGPLVIGTGVNSVVIGIISACLVKERTNKCYGPFLYTSVFKNRNLISCAIYKDIANDCNKLFRSSVTHTEESISWKDHEDGPAKNELGDTKNENKNTDPPVAEDQRPSDKSEGNQEINLRAKDKINNGTNVTES